MADLDILSVQAPRGYLEIHPDRSLNFQLNRWITYLGSTALEDILPVVPRLTNAAAYAAEFQTLAEKALAEGRNLHAAFYFRSAEFFLLPSDPKKRGLRQKFLELIWENYHISPADRLMVPYSDGAVSGSLPAYRFSPPRVKAILLLHGGFDSYIEEFFPLIQPFTRAGYEVICFDGPGQGGALYGSGLHLTHAWQHPVRAVLDYFGVQQAGLLGISMGGCLALRAAAYEPRITRVVAYDVFYDWLDTTLAKFPPGMRLLVRLLMGVRAAGLFNAIFERLAQENSLMAWAVEQAKDIMGLPSLYEVYVHSQKYTTRDVSPLVKQDVLLLAGSADHLVPLDQFYRQIQALSAARTLTTRLFTGQEQAQNHCQVGNIGLALRVILDWLAQTESPPS